MPSRPAPPASSAARTLHSFLIASTLIVSIGAFVAARSSGPLRSGIAPLDYLALVLGAAALLGIPRLRERLPPRAAGQSVDEWWAGQLGRAVLLWALLEFSAMLGAATLLITRQPWGSTALAGLAIAGLLWFSPTRLAGR
jgi:hypothetical protein